jgi:hypothetical protein
MDAPLMGRHSRRIKDVYFQLLAGTTGPGAAARPQHSLTG